MAALAQQLLDELNTVPAIDAHTHLVGGRLGARGLHDILLYHMSISDLYAAGCPDGERLTQYPGWPGREEAHGRIRRALPWLGHVRNTSTQWGVRMILADLYDWSEPVTETNWQRLDDRIRERADDRAWHREILKRAAIAHACTEIARREDGTDDDLLDYALEWAFFTRCQWGEYDTALYELERCWGNEPSSPTPIGPGGRPATDRVIRSLEDVHEAIDWYLDHIPDGRIKSIATHISTDIDYRPVDDETMVKALGARDEAGIEERDIYASYINEAFLDGFERRYGAKLVFQFSLGAEPLPHETASRLQSRTIAHLAEMVGRHPGIEFQCFLASAHANQALCTLARELPNLSLAGFWWHNFFPSMMRRVFAERLDMLPLNRQIGFFSDAYCVEWAYAKSRIVRQVMAEGLADRIELGQYDKIAAIRIGRALLEESPRAMLGLGT